MSRCLCAIVLSLALASPLWASTVTYLQGTETTWASSASLASNAQLLGSPITPVNYLFANCNLTITTSSVAPTAGTAITAWILPSTDGSTYPDGGTSVTPARQPDMIFPVRAVTTAQVIDFRLDKMPAGLFELLVRNDGTGATINTWSVKCRPFTLQQN